MKRRFATLDVFTDKALAGNPLAVVLEPDGLDTPAMLAIAREFNLSETVFVCPPANRSSRANVRIFTPARELPFAGHPTVGTAVLAANAKQVEDYRAGKEKAFNSLVGQVMKATKGKANPQEAGRLLREKLDG